jgi:spoIIIJ-associated protein
MVGEISEQGGTARLEVEAASAGEAKWKAMKQLERRYPGLDVADVEFELADGDGDSARVTAIADLEAWEDARQEFSWPEEPAERVRELLRRILSQLDLRASVDVEDGPEEITASISGSELGLLIGKRGQTIDSIQFLCSQAAFRGQAGRKRVVVDAGGYRQRREAAVRRQADRGVADAVRFGRAVELDSMTAQERRVVHTYLRDRPEVETHSEGDDPFRRVVITPLGGRSQR